MASSSSSGTATSKTHRLLEAAFHGNLRRLKNVAAELDDGKGIAKTVAGVRDSNGLSALHLAALTGMVDICKYLVDDLKLEVDIKGAIKGEIPLHEAALTGKLSTANYLLKKGANPDMKNNLAFTPLHHTADKGHEELLRLLLSKGANVDPVSIAGTPLQRAAGLGKHKVVKILLDHYANPNLPYDGAYTPLMTSIAVNSLECVELLLKAGADPEAASFGLTPLEFASGEHTDVVRCLLKAGANPNVTNEEGLTPIEIAASSGNFEGVKILYPLTSPIPTYLDWSLHGIMRHACSGEARAQNKLNEMEKYGEAKSKADGAFREKDYHEAAFYYSMAIDADPSNATLRSNRSLCFVLLKFGDAALHDAVACIKLKPDWPKAHYRLGAAWNVLEKFDRAADAFFEGLKLDPENKELRNAYQEAVDARLKSINISK